MAVFERGRQAIFPLALWLLVVVGTCARDVGAAPPNPSTRGSRAANNSSSGEDDGGNGGGGESNLDWLGRHWYVFVVLLVMIVVVCVFLCGCVVRRSKLGHYHMEMNHNSSNRHSPIGAYNYPTFTGTAQTAHYYSPQHSSNTEDAGSSITRHTESSFMGVPSSAVSRGSLSADTPPTASPQIGGDSDSPWSFIQSVAKARARRGEEGEERGRGGGRERRRGGGGASPGQDSFERSGRHSHHRHHHHNRHHHSHSHLHRQHRPHRGHQRTLSNPLVKDGSGTSLCSVPSTVSGSMQSDQSNQSRSNRSSHSHSDNSTVVEVSVNVRLSPDQLSRAKVVTMAALAESARQLAQSAAEFGREEQPHTRSLPHSPHPPPHNSHRQPRHSVTGAPLTPHSLPPSSLLDHSHLFQSHSSSHLPPLRTDTLGSQPASPRTRQTISLDRKSMRHYYPIAMTVMGGPGTEDEGTVVSLDRNSSSSSCHCPSSVAFEQGQRSLLTQSPLGVRGSSAVNPDQYSSIGTDNVTIDTTVVSLDRPGRSNTREHRLWPASQSLLLANPEPHAQQASAVYRDDCSGSHGNHRVIHGHPSGCYDDHPGKSGNQSSSSSSSSSGNSRTHLPHHIRHNNPTNVDLLPQQTAQLNLDSQIEDTPPIMHTSSNSFHTRESFSPKSKATTSEELCMLNGYSFHAHIPFPHSHPSPSPKVALHQQLQNISEQGENECLHSSDNNFDLNAGDRRSDTDDVTRLGSAEWTAESGLGQVVMEEEQCINEEARMVARSKDRKKKGRRKKERQNLQKEGWGERKPSSLKNLCEHSVTTTKKQHTNGHVDKDCSDRLTNEHSGARSPSPTLLRDSPPELLRSSHHSVSHQNTSLSDHAESPPPSRVLPAHPDSSPPDRANLATLPDHPESPPPNRANPSALPDHPDSSPPNRANPSALPDHPDSSPPNRADSPPRSSNSALSVSEPLSSTASGYAATGESGSTCSVEVKSNGDCLPGLEDIQKALYDARSQFSYPLQRLLDQDYELGGTELDVGSTVQPTQSHSQSTQSHTGSDSTHFQTHSMPLTYRSRVQSMQQIQSVDV